MCHVHRALRTVVCGVPVVGRCCVCRAGEQACLDERVDDGTFVRREASALHPPAGGLTAPLHRHEFEQGG